jgi:hypothetical protein
MADVCWASTTMPTHLNIIFQTPLTKDRPSSRTSEASIDSRSLIIAESRDGRLDRDIEPRAEEALIEFNN